MQANKHKKAVSIKEGDWVWLHLRPERFPQKRKNKLAPRGDGPFRVLKKINENAYQLELPGEYNVSSTFNICDLLPFDAGETHLETKRTQPGGNDEDIQTNKAQEDQEMPKYTPPLTRRQSMRFQCRTNGFVSSFNNGCKVTLGHQDESTNELDEGVTCEAKEPNEPLCEPSPSLRPIDYNMLVIHSP